MLGPDFLPGLDPVQDSLGDGHLLRVAQLQGGLLIRQPAPSTQHPFLSLAEKTQIFAANCYKDSYGLRVHFPSTLKITDF
jgi:hypothetical protein